MTKTIKSIYYFSFYLLAAGLGLFLIPNLILPVFGIPPSPEVWIRLVGALTFILGIFFNYMARNNVEKFAYISMFGRGTFSLAILASVFIFGAPYGLLIFALVDVIGLIWTLISYKSEN